MALARPSFESLMSLAELAEQQKNAGHQLEADLLKGHLALELANYIFSESTDPFYRYHFMYQFYAINTEIMSLLLNGKHSQKRALFDWHYDGLISAASHIHTAKYQPPYLPDTSEVVRFGMFSRLQIQMCNAILADDGEPLSEAEPSPRPATPPPGFF